jgi:hypothetical protein
MMTTSENPGGRIALINRRKRSDQMCVVSAYIRFRRDAIRRRKYALPAGWIAIF